LRLAAPNRILLCRFTKYSRKTAHAAPEAAAVRESPRWSATAAVTANVAMKLR